MRSAIEWEMDFEKSTGKTRKQFNRWNIPKSIKTQHGIIDGDKVLLTVMHGRMVLFNDVVSVTSGGEISFGSELSERIKRIAIRKPNSSLIFSLGRRDALSGIRSAFEGDVQKAKALSSEERHKRLQSYSKKPKRILIPTWVFERNPNVVAEVLLRAAAICRGCGKRAPFDRRTDGSPYLEVHHKTQLALGGEDTVENAIALCPNCHRKEHFG